MSLTWALDANRVSVHRTLVAIAYETAESTVKTRHSRRVIDLAPDTIAVLCAWRERRIEEGGHVEPDIIFARADGSGLHPHTLSQAFERLTVRSGQPVIRFHDLRHTCSTRSGPRSKNTTATSRSPSAQRPKCFIRRAAMTSTRKRLSTSGAC